ncbi:MULTISPECIES: hypothetical protein [Pandoraea]|uniref:Uncharacterized protein n=2 Tax=Pandoraea TaxID=93217 RepID=A0A5E4XG40_9BURK|nr:MULTISPECIES: hypothetical protein [Pandoraea]VVE17318.1 hypothetical protein PCE31107_02963 [Pandoraea cepalis]VVE35100.1 hypothetical protein PTE31013_03883 [Pandoraea terrigena]
MILEAHDVLEIIGGGITIVTAVLSFILRYHTAVVKRYRRDKDIACGDIAFLLAIEAEYIVLLRERDVAMEPGIKVAMRNRVRANGLEFSGKFTPGRVAASRASHGLKPAFYRVKANLDAMGDRSEPA